MVQVPPCRMVLEVKVLPENGRTGGQRTSDLDGPGPLGDVIFP